MRPAHDIRRHPENGGAGAMMLVLAAALIFLYLVRWILLPFVIAGVLAYICTSPISWLAARARLPRPLFAVAVFAVVLAVPGMLAFLAVPPFFREVMAIASDFKGTLASLAGAVIGDKSVDWFGPRMNAQQIADATVGAVHQWLGASGNWLMLTTWTLAGVFGLFLTLVLLLYFLLSGPQLARSLFWLVPPPHRPLAERVWARLDPVLKRYFVGVIAVVTYASVAAYIGLGLVLGITHAAVLALLTGILEMIPFIGPAASAIIAGLVAIRQAAGVRPILEYAAYATALRLSIDQIFGPLVLGRAARLNPTVVIFCFLAGGVLFGAAGVIMAVPVALAIRNTLAVLYEGPTAAEDAKEGMGSVPTE
jgi:predicted PurR-regulated permease PerM